MKSRFETVMTHAAHHSPYVALEAIRGELKSTFNESDIELLKGIHDRIRENFKIEDELDEFTFSASEEGTHIKEAFFDGIMSARGNGGGMSEQCHRKFSFLGINSGAAQHQIHKYFEQETSHVKEHGVLPDFGMTLTFLREMAGLYRGSAQKLAITRGIDILYKPKPVQAILNTQGENHEKGQTGAHADQE